MQCFQIKVKFSELLNVAFFRYETAILLFKPISPLPSWGVGVFSQDLVYRNDNGMLEMDKFAYIFEDKNASLSFEQAKALLELSFQQNKEASLNFTQTSSRIWFLFNVKNATSEPLYLIFKTQDVDEIDVYLEDEAGKIITYKTGVMRPFWSRHFLTNWAVFPIGMHPKKIYVSVRDTHTFFLSAHIAPNQPMVNRLHGESLYNGAFLGIMFVIIFLNFCVFLMLRDRTYLLYCLYAFSYFFFLL